MNRTSFGRKCPLRLKPLLVLWPFVARLEAAPFQSRFAQEAGSWVRFFVQLKAQSSIDCENLSGNKLRRHGEEENCCGNLISSPVALHWSLFRHPPHERGG